jgi:cytidine deaminase
MPCNVELVFALVAPIGSDLDAITEILSDYLQGVKHHPVTVRLTDSFTISKSDREHRNGKKYYSHLMDYGDELRRSARNNAAVAGLAAAAIKKVRHQDVDIPVCVIVRQLKTPEEVARLREIYGSRLFVMSCYSARKNRIETLARRLADRGQEIQIEKFRADAESLILRDEQDPRDKWGQNVRKTFPTADFFVDADSREGLQQSLGRMLEILFGHPFHTPTRDEYGMYLAEAAALRSAALGRQVGAVVTTRDGDIVSVGCNEVPKAGGGLYWESDAPDQRDFTLGHDTNDRFKEKLLGEVLHRLIEKNWIRKGKAKKGIKRLIDRLLYRANNPILAGTQVDSIIEFGRCVHAEMAAVVDAARRGAAVNGGVLYTTTFPCHECARHIVAAGIKRVIYRLPYPKSLVRELYPDSIDIDDEGCHTGRVAFSSFVGVAPRRYNSLFTMRARKDDKGIVIKWSAENAKPVLGEYFPGHDLIEDDEDACIAAFATSG